MSIQGANLQHSAIITMEVVFIFDKNMPSGRTIGGGWRKALLSPSENVAFVLVKQCFLPEKSGRFVESRRGG